MNSLGAGGNGFDVDGRGPSDAIAYPNLYQVFGDQANTTAQQIMDSLSTWAASQAENALSAAALEQIYQIQANSIINNNGTDNFLNNVATEAEQIFSSHRRALL